MTGFASKRAMNREFGSLNAKATWQDHLRAWEQAAITKYLISGTAANANQDIISDCMDQMQVLFPGNYTLVWHQPAPNEYHLTVHFADPKHETMWRMKYA
jgi:hypothetical protein